MAAHALNVAKTDSDLGPYIDKLKATDETAMDDKTVDAALSDLLDGIPESDPSAKPLVHFAETTPVVTPDAFASHKDELVDIVLGAGA